MGTLLSDFKADLRPGALLEVTNHYINREDHPAFGTTERRVTSVNGSAFYLGYVGSAQSESGRVAWPKASQLSLELGPDGGGGGRVWKIAGGGQYRPVPENTPFLTIKVVALTTTNPNEKEN